MTTVEFEFKDGTKLGPIDLNWLQWQEMWRSGQWDNKKIEFVNVEKKHSDKGPSRIKFL